MSAGYGQEGGYGVGRIGPDQSFAPLEMRPPPDGQERRWLLVPEEGGGPKYDGALEAFSGQVVDCSAYGEVSFATGYLCRVRGTSATLDSVASNSDCHQHGAGTLDDSMLADLLNAVTGNAHTASEWRDHFFA